MKNLGNPHHHILKHVYVGKLVHVQLGEVGKPGGRICCGGGAPWWAAPLTLPKLCWHWGSCNGNWWYYWAPGYLSYLLVTSSALEFKTSNIGCMAVTKFWNNSLVLKSSSSNILCGLDDGAPCWQPPSRFICKLPVCPPPKGSGRGT